MTHWPTDLLTTSNQEMLAHLKRWRKRWITENLTGKVTKKMKEKVNHRKSHQKSLKKNWAPIWAKDSRHLKSIWCSYETEILHGTIRTCSHGKKLNMVAKESRHIKILRYFDNKNLLIWTIGHGSRLIKTVDVWVVGAKYFPLCFSTMILWNKCQKIADIERQLGAMTEMLANGHVCHMFLHFE